MMIRPPIVTAIGGLFSALLCAVTVFAQEPSSADKLPSNLPPADLKVSRSAAPNISNSAKSPTPPSAEQIAGWLKDLNDPQYLVREAATQHLNDAGAVALDPLLVAANSNQPEPAERATWILRRFSRSRDSEFAFAALERLAQLKNDPTLATKAQSEIAERSLTICQQRLTALGADFVVAVVQDGMQGVAPMITVRLGERWHGKTEDLLQLAKLKQQRHFRLDGPAVNDDVVKLFADKEKLSLLQLFNTRVTVAAIDAVKAKHADAILFVRNTAMLGVGGEPNAAGVLVKNVPPGTGAATAGILVGDIITALDGQKIPDFDRLTAHIAQHQPGDKIEVELIRNDKTMKVAVVLGKWSDNEQQ